MRIGWFFRKRRLSVYLISFYTTAIAILATTAIVVWKFRDECYQFPIPPSEEHFRKCGNVIGKTYYDNKIKGEQEIEFLYSKDSVSEPKTKLNTIHRDLRTAEQKISMSKSLELQYEDKLKTLERMKEIRSNATEYFEEQRKMAQDACLKMFYDEESINFDITNDEKLFSELKKLEKLEKGENRFFMQTKADRKTRWIFYKHPDPLNNVEIQWCPIYKAASTPWMAIFTTLSKALTSITEAKIRKGKITFVNLAKDFRLFQKGEMKTSSGGENSPRFSMVVVRHPFQRLLSAYQDKIERIRGREFYYRKYSKKIIKRFRDTRVNGNEELIQRTGRKPLWYQMAMDLQNRYYRPPPPKPTITLSTVVPSKQVSNKSNTYSVHTTTTVSTPRPTPEVMTPPTFEEFCRYLLTVDPKIMDEHWRPQYLDCSPCHHKFDLILKVEDLEEDKNQVFKLLGYEDPKSEEYTELEQVWKRWSNKASQFQTHIHDESFYFSQLSEELMQNLYHIYELDFELYGYSADEYFDMVKSQ